MNPSHDLRLVYIFVNLHKRPPANTKVNQEMRKLLLSVKYDYNFGTAPMKTGGAIKILNVSDMHKRLVRLFDSNREFYKEHDAKYDAGKLAGTLDVYLDRSQDMRFVGV